MEVQRIASVDPLQFVETYIAANRPVIVSDAMASWPGRQLWTPKYLSERFGHLSAQVYNDLFMLQRVMPLKQYLAECFGRAQPAKDPLYVRWYVRFKAVDFIWSDEVFSALESEWGHPYFLPTTSYALPLCRPPNEVFAHRDAFPYKGLFISPKGARTRLHRDPFGTDAVLCQFFGTKTLLLFDPSEDSKLRRVNEFVDVEKPDLERFPQFPHARPKYEDELRPGEILFIPSGWLHHVVCASDSISVTWNFAHAAHRDAFVQAINDPANDFDRDMLAYLYRQEGERVSVGQMTHLARSL